MIVENLKYFLYQFSENDPLYFGIKFQTFVYQGYMSGGAGYVISKDALRRLVLLAFGDPKLCVVYVTEHEDVELGSCLANVGVLAGDTRDLATPEKKGRFYVYNIESHILPPVPATKIYWYWAYLYYQTSDGIGSLSDTAISFHYIRPREMYFLDHFIYSLKPYGITHADDKLLPKINFDDLKTHFRKEKAVRAKVKYSEYKVKRQFEKSHDSIL